VLQLATQEVGGEAAIRLVFRHPCVGPVRPGARIEVGKHCGDDQETDRERDHKLDQREAAAASHGAGMFVGGGCHSPAFEESKTVLVAVYENVSVEPLDE
jgi:hypothetical protein